MSDHLNMMKDSNCDTNTKLIEEARLNREKSLIWATSFGIFLRLFVIIFEFIGFYLFSSHSLLDDPISSTFDIRSSFCLLFFIKFAAKPPDRNHPFGLGRFEPIAGFQLGLLLVFFGFAFVFNHIWKVSVTDQVHILDTRAWFIALTATIFLEICYRVTHAIATKQNSTALISEAIHYRIDALTSLIACFALSFAYFFPGFANMIDNFGALIIAIFMVVLGIKASMENFHQLTDHIPKEEYFQKVRSAASGVVGVKDIKKLLIQQYGPDAHINIDIEVEPDLTVEVGHEIAEKVKAEIQKRCPEVRDATVHIEPHHPAELL